MRDLWQIGSAQLGLPDAPVSYVGGRLRKVNDPDKPPSTAAESISQDLVRSRLWNSGTSTAVRVIAGQQCGVASPDHIRHMCS